MKYKSIISTQVKDENEYLDEWIDYHLGIGFEHIVIYDNGSVIPVQSRNRVTVIPESRKFEANWEENPHMDTVRNFDADWIARIDVDEFIVLKQHKNINDLLEPYKEFGGLGINWRIFGTSGHIKKPEGLVHNNYVWRVPDNVTNIINGGSSHVKTIIRREFCTLIPHPHFCYSTRPLVNEDFVPYPDAFTDSSRSKCVIHHYVTKSREEWDAKFNLWRRNFGWRNLNDLADIERNCIVYDNSLTDKAMYNEKNWKWASHQPMIKAVLELYNPEFILELGIGENSTPLFAGLSYIGIENNREWIDHMKKHNTNQIFLWHNLDKYPGHIEDYYKQIEFPVGKMNLMFVDNYESCRTIAINTLRDKFGLIIFHDCEPYLGAVVNQYAKINADGFNQYYLKTSNNWTAVMINKTVDLGYNKLLNVCNKYIAEFKKTYPEVELMMLDNKYE